MSDIHEIIASYNRCGSYSQVARELQKAGMSYEKKGKGISMGKGRISELHQGKMRKIRRSQYDALMKAT